MRVGDRQTNQAEADAREAWIRTGAAQVILDRTDPEEQAEVRAALEELGFHAGASKASLRLVDDH